MAFFDNLDPLLRSFWYIAIPVSVIFVLQTILTFTGADSTDGVDADFDSDLTGTDAPFQLFSLRNLINFLLGFSWTGISFFETIDSAFWLILLSVLVGLVFVYVFFLIIRNIVKLAEDNSMKLEDALGKSAEVYVPIPSNFSGKGKVLVSLKGSSRELDAITAGERIATGKLVEITGIKDSQLLIVKTV